LEHERGGGGSGMAVNDIKMGGGKKDLSSVLNVPRQCSLILLVSVHHLFRINLNLISGR
jgi:hypothetical protein